MILRSNEILTTAGMIRTLFIFCLWFPAYSLPQTELSAPPAKAVASTEQASDENPKQSTQSPQQLIETIRSARKAITEKITATQERLKQAESKSSEQQVEELKEQIELLETIDLVHSQQTEELETLKTSMAQLKQYQQESAQPGAKAQDTVSFLELDRVREELNDQLQRKDTVNAKVEFAESALEQAQDTFKERENTAQEFTETGAASGKEIHQPDGTDRIELLRLKAGLAAEILRLRKFELRNEKLANSIYQIQIDLIAKRVEALKQKAVFTKEVLTKQLQLLDEKAQALKRELAQALERQVVVNGRLAQVRGSLTKSSPDRRKAVSAEADAKRLEAEALKTKIENLSEQIEFQDNRKTAWERRYRIFNFAVDEDTGREWKSEISQHIDQLEKDQHFITQSLTDWQNQLTALNTTIEHGDSPSVLQWLKLEQKQIQQIIGSLLEHQAFLENTGRLQKKLGTEIDTRTASQNWWKWLDWIFDFEIYQNKVLHWLYAIAGVLVSFSLFLFIRRLVVSRLERYAEIHRTSFINGLVASARRTNTLFLFALAIYIGTSFLDFSLKTTLLIRNVIKVAVILQGTIWVSDFVRAWIFRYMTLKAKRGEESRSALGVINFLSQALVWSIALLLAMQNFGVDITALVAGLGIGGVAVALALQRVLGDLFSSLAIVLDKPFVSGDFINFDNTFLGTVEHIGIKTTRLRSLGGEQIICSNSDLLSARIRNYKRMQERRVVFNIGVVYQTPYEKLEKIPAMLEEIIKSQENTKFDRAHFFQYGDFALIFEIVYYVLSPDYNLYMDIQQTINMQIFKRFAQERIEFAYPTQSLIVQTTSETRDTSRNALQESSA